MSDCGHYFRMTLSGSLHCNKCDTFGKPEQVAFFLNGEIRNLKADNKRLRSPININDIEACAVEEFMASLNKDVGVSSIVLEFHRGYVMGLRGE